MPKRDLQDLQESKKNDVKVGIFTMLKSQNKNMSTNQFIFRESHLSDISITNLAPVSDRPEVSFFCESNESFFLLTDKIVIC